MPEFYHRLDALVLPSRSRPNWMEQFGRVLIEAMACGVPVVGADSGEIPHVIDGAGLTFPEGDVGALRARLEQLMSQPHLRADLIRRGRARVLDQYTQARVAAETVTVYREMMAQSPGPRA
jgi:glycosyltransferase involved in cell wall biosynthesis